jgi:hypothetical protein
MNAKIETMDRATQKLVYADVDRALVLRGVDPEDPIRDELLDRVEVLQGYRSELVVRTIDDTRTLVPADVCLDQLLNRKPGHVFPRTLGGPMRIPMSDKEALFSADPTKISRGELVPFDDRSSR